MKRLLLILFIGGLLQAQTARTTITQTITGLTGNWAGVIEITGPSLRTADGVYHVGGTERITVTAGVPFSVALWPNVGSTASGGRNVYTVTYYGAGKTLMPEFWTVPVSATPITIAACFPQTTPPLADPGRVNWAVMAQLGATHGQAIVWDQNIMQWVPGDTVGGVSSWNDLTDKPAEFPSNWATLSGKPNTFPSDWPSVSGKPTYFPVDWAAMPVGEQIIYLAGLIGVDPATTLRYTVFTSGLPTGSCEQGRDIGISTNPPAFLYCPNGNWEQPPGTGGGSSSVTGLYSGPLNFPELALGQCHDLALSASGLAAGASLAAAPPTGLPAGVIPTFIAEADSLKVRLCNFSSNVVDLGSITYSARNVESLGYGTAQATLDFGSIALGQTKTLPLTLNGAEPGDNLAPGYPALPAGVVPSMSITASNTVTVQLTNFGLNPATINATFRAAFTK